MKKIDKVIHALVFICFIFYFLWLSISIYNTVRFLKTKKVVFGKIVPTDIDVSKLNRVPVKVVYYDSYIGKEREGLVKVDPLKFKEIISKGEVAISYGEFSDEIYVTSYKEPNRGRLAISIMGWFLVALILAIYIKRFSRKQ
ncbi:MAG TPA: hypothetical protein VHN59_04745 [Chitinophagaceae bacterium]|nr:hypothetical protein [Chitinophagaceae bacterium]